MTDRNSNVIVLLALGFGSAAGCGPELLPVTPDVVSGYYRAASMQSDESCGNDVVWSTEVYLGYSRDGYDALFAEAVPIRADVDHLEVPEPKVGLETPPPGGGAGAGVVAWKMRRLAWTSESYELEAAFDITFCEDYRHTWSAAALDEETIRVTREGTGCGPGDGQSRICDNRLEIEYELVDACEEPCAFVDDGETRFPGVDLEDIILFDSRCEC